MRVGVLGSGVVGRTLAEGFSRHGQETMLGTRNAAKLKDWQKQNASTTVGSFADAARFGDIVVLSVKGMAALDVLRAAGADNLAHKPVIDTTNPIDESPPVNGVLRFFTTLDESLLERLQREFGDARFVKAFNSVGAARMVNPHYKEGMPTMFICGNDAAAKKTVAGILVEFGWDVADMGGAEAARAIEPLCMLWCIRGLRDNEWTSAFKLLRVS
jgi:8-hydroxy-5-deazaflavin:NADPH oxidoreductase